MQHPPLRFGGEVHCQGDALADVLRVARMRVERTAADVRSAAARVREMEESGFEIGYLAEAILGRIEDGYLEQMESRDLKSRAYNLRAEVDTAEDYDEIPEREAYQPLKTLAEGLDDYAHAIEALRKTEKTCYSAK